SVIRRCRFNVRFAPKADMAERRAAPHSVPQPPARARHAPRQLHQNRQRDGHNGGNRRDAQSRLWASGNGALLPVRRLWTQPPQPPNHGGNIDREREQNHGRNDQNGGSIGAVKPTSNSSTSSRSPSSTN